MNFSNNNYNKKLKNFARVNRNNGTKAEVRIWCELLRNKKMLGFSFLRQRPIENYIADFFCIELKLVIEIDGFTHQFEEVIKKDNVKEECLMVLGYTVLRFSDDDVMKDIENVSRVLEEWIERRRIVQAHPPAPFEGGQENPRNN